MPLRLDLDEPRVDLAPLVAALAEGACAVIPTDTVYGLVCDAGQADACLRLSEIKRRDPRKPSTAMFASVSDAETLLAPLEPALAQRARALLGRGATVLVPEPGRRLSCTSDRRRIRAASASGSPPSRPRSRP